MGFVGWHIGADDRSQQWFLRRCGYDLHIKGDPSNPLTTPISMLRSLITGRCKISYWYLLIVPRAASKTKTTVAATKTDAATPKTAGRMRLLEKIWVLCQVSFP